jgi:tetratricopeptide (TPR) repeat protein
VSYYIIQVYICTNIYLVQQNTLFVVQITDFEKSKQLKLLYGYRGLMLQSIGDQKKSFNDFEKSSEHEPSDPQPIFLMAESYAALGNFRRAVECFDIVLRMSPDNNMAYFKRELAFYLNYRLNTPLYSYNPDNEVDEGLKFGLAKALSVSESGYPRASTGERYSVLYTNTLASDDNLTTSLSLNEVNKIKEMLDQVSYLGDWLQLDTPGERTI